MQFATERLFHKEKREMFLVPGAVFELRATDFDQDRVTKVILELAHNLPSIHTSPTGRIYVQTNLTFINPLLDGSVEALFELEPTTLNDNNAGHELACLIIRLSR
ncbi:UNVERIFIED_CONTAM: hypothetical protein NCL1_22522 [Trichonephila clavipes]